MRKVPEVTEDSILASGGSLLKLQAANNESSEVIDSLLPVTF